MKTKYILYGGYATAVNEENNKFFREILKTDKKDLLILLILFAAKEGEYDHKFERATRQFNINNPDKTLKFEIASRELFREQLKRADIVYLYGGDNLRLLNTLKEYPDFPELIKGKIVAGESAGAYVLSACFYSRTQDRCFEGLNILPVKTIGHFVGKFVEKLDNCPANLEKLLLPEHQYKVFELK